jgi:hypothetical protein
MKKLVTVFHRRNVNVNIVFQTTGVSPSLLSIINNTAQHWMCSNFFFGAIEDCFILICKYKTHFLKNSFFFSSIFVANRLTIDNFKQRLNVDFIFTVGRCVEFWMRCSTENLHVTRITAMECTELWTIIMDIIKNAYG